MKILGFNAEASIYRTKNWYDITSGVLDVLLSEGKVLPQQAHECETTNGPCTGFWPWYQGEQCVTGPNTQEQHCCTKANTWPAIRECKNPDGTWRVVSKWCGVCFW